MARFVYRVLVGFDRNNGFVLAGAMAYSALLSVVPLGLVLTAVLSGFVEPELVMATVERQLRDVLLPGQSAMLVKAVAALMDSAEVSGGFGGLGLLFFATSGFRVMQAAFAQIFAHRLSEQGPRSLLRSVMLSIGLLAALGVLLLLRIQLGHLGLGVVGSLLNVGSGFLGMMLVVAGLYRVVPRGGLPWRASLAAGALVAALWETFLQLLAWYFGSLSQINVLYGSMATVVLLLVTIEYAAAIILIGAHVIAEVERARAAGLPWYDAAGGGRGPDSLRPPGPATPAPRG